MKKLFAGLYILVVALLSFVLPLNNSAQAAATVPFTCDGTFYFTSSLTTTAASTQSRYSFSTSPVTSITVGTYSNTVNAVGYRTQDNFLYAMGRNEDPDTGNLNHLYKFDSAGGETDLGVVAGVDGAFIPLAADFGSDGFLYVINGNNADTAMYKVDVGAVSATTLTMSQGLTDAFDIGFNKNDGLFYGYNSNDGGGAGQIFSLSTTGQVTLFGPNYAFDDFGAVWMVGNELFGYDSRTGIIRGFNVELGSPTRGNLTGTIYQAPLIGDGDLPTQHDGAICQVAATPPPPAPDLPAASTNSLPSKNSPIPAILLTIALIGLTSTAVGYTMLKKAKSTQIGPKK